MTLRCEVHNRPRPMLPQQRTHQLRIADVSCDQLMPPITLQRLQIRRIPRIAQRIEIHHRRASALNPSQNKIRPDKTGAARNQNRVLNRFIP